MVTTEVPASFAMLKAELLSLPIFEKGLSLSYDRFSGLPGRWTDLHPPILPDPLYKDLNLKSSFTLSRK